MARLRIVLAQVRPTKGDYAANLRLAGAVLARASQLDPPADLVVFPECVMSGYFVEGGVRELAVTAGTLFRDLAQQHAASGAGSVDVVVGFYEEFRNRLFNSALYAQLGGPDARVVHVHRKVFLPTYGLFDEERFVERGRTVRAFDTRWGRAAILICEDAWHSLSATLAALDGAQVIAIPSASPGRGVVPEREPPADGVRPASARRWETLVRRMAEEHGVFVALAQLVGFEGGKGFPGSSTVVGPQGEVLVRGPAFADALVVADVDTDHITRARAELPLLADLEVQLLNLLRNLDRPVGAVEFDPEDACPRAVRPVAAADLPSVEAQEGGDPLAIDPALTAVWLEEFLKDEVRRRRGFDRVVVGVSGGVDSATTAVLAARAFGPEKVLAVRLPYRTSSPHSMQHAAELAEAFGIPLTTVDITQAVDGYVAAADPQMDDRRRGNVMARVRMITLFDLAMKYGALPLGTGNKTERLLGYFTWHADDSPPVNPLGDLFKTQVRALARHLGVPEHIVRKPATADLVPGQTDEADLGITYEKADRILYWLLRGLRHAEIVSKGFSADEVAHVYRRLQSTHWKRRLPTVAVVSDTAIGESYLRPVDY